ncbi:hypothetical protein B4135_0489 [Caldibacillus debilis]|uniref:Uncharacterized protein n=1 Tax=Caldibacillus debilis TaxID=301148 RepID=A0A150L922_9BACI|nr:hypothetical protein B4135_0489 [Caldibacillus debilis]
MHRLSENFSRKESFLYGAEMPNVRTARILPFSTSIYIYIIHLRAFH